MVLNQDPIQDRRHVHREPVPMEDLPQIFWKRLDEQQTEIRELRESRVEDRARLSSLESSLSELNQRVSQNHAELKVAQQHNADASERNFNRLYAEVRQVAEALTAHDVRRAAHDELREELEREKRQHTNTWLKTAAVGFATVAAVVALATYVARAGGL